VDDTTKLMQELLDRYKTGIQISQVSLQNAQPPQEVQAAFDDAVKAKADEERQKNEGMAYANNVVPRAKGEAARLVQEAEGYRQAVIANAQGDASRFKQILVAYNKAPRVTRERMYIDTMQQILSSTTKVLVDQKNANNLLYLPLDKLIQNTNPVTVTAPSGAQPAAKPAEQSASSSTSGEPPLERDRRDRP
jgi:membrane protease subunit HflK